MPLTPLQFRLRVTSDTEHWMRAVHAFLHAHPDLAYSQTELLDALGGDVTADTGSISQAMHELIYLGGVDARRRETLTYYRYLDPIPELE